MAYDPMRDDPENAWPIICELRERVAQLEALLRESQRPHRAEGDPWYSCPLSEDGCHDDRIPKDVCMCGAEEWNAQVRELLGAD